MIIMWMFSVSPPLVSCIVLLLCIYLFIYCCFLLACFLSAQWAKVDVKSHSGGFFLHQSSVLKQRVEAARWSSVSCFTCPIRHRAGGSDLQVLLTNLNCHHEHRANSCLVLALMLLLWSFSFPSQTFITPLPHGSSMTFVIWKQKWDWC